MVSAGNDGPQSLFPNPSVSPLETRSIPLADTEPPDAAYVRSCWRGVGRAFAVCLFLHCMRAGLSRFLFQLDQEVELPGVGMFSGTASGMKKMEEKGAEVDKKKAKFVGEA